MHKDTFEYNDPPPHRKKKRPEKTKNTIESRKLKYVGERRLTQ